MHKDTSCAFVAFIIAQLWKKRKSGFGGSERKDFASCRICDRMGESDGKTTEMSVLTQLHMIDGGGHGFAPKHDAIAIKILREFAGR
jgi:hypothetical protein